MEYNKEQLNYFRICYIVTKILTTGLRIIFKQEWDSRYGTTRSGEWKDEPKNGMDFRNKESPRNQRKHAHLHTTMTGGNRAEWDCTMLFYAILYSDCIHGLNPVVRSNVDTLRKFRNEDFAHISDGNLPDVQFRKVIGKVHAAFEALGLSTLEVQEIENQKSFPTKELTLVLKKVEDLRQELQEKGMELKEKEEQRQALEDQLNSKISPFCVLPAKPSHDVTGRDREVTEIMQQLKELGKQNKLGYLYISGNPGSGKSQLAGLVAEKYYEEAKTFSENTSFVMTINGKSPDTVLQSYVDFSRQLRCPEHAVTKTLTSDGLTTDEKIANLKSLMGPKVKLYASWLVVVDNVTSILRVHVHLPDAENEVWARGQLLITTQDTAAIPNTSPFIQNIVVSKGMKPSDACCLLEKLSGIKDSKMEINVAEALDYQPLALASAATYIREVRKMSSFGWNDYLTELKNGRRSTTEIFLAETNPSYPKSMTTATTLAVEKAMATDKVIHHAFNFLSVCALQPLGLNIIVDYIIGMAKDIEDKEIRLKIRRCSLLVFKTEEREVYIRVHQVVHSAIKTVTEAYSNDKHNEVVNGVFGSFKSLVKHFLSKDNDDLHALVNGRHVIPHLRPLAAKLERNFPQQITSQVDKSEFLIMDYPHDLRAFGKFSYRHSEFEAARIYLSLALNLFNVFQPDAVLAIAATHNKLGSTNSKLGELEKAVHHYNRALTIYMERFGPEHNGVAKSCNNLGSVHDELGDLEKAKGYFRRALDIRLKNYGVHHLKLTTTYNRMGNVYKKLGDLKQAQNYHNFALSIRLKELGPEHVDVAISCNNLGRVHHNQGNLKKARDYYNRARAIFLKKLGPDHVHMVTTYSNLGQVHRELGNLDRAEDYYHRALVIRKRTELGSGYVDVANFRNNLNAHTERV